MHDWGEQEQATLYKFKMGRAKMTKDYAKRRRNQHLSRRSESQVKYQSIPAWLWMVAGLLVGITLSGLLYWKLHRTQSAPHTIVDIQEDPPKANKAAVTKKSKKVTLAANTPDTPKNSSRFDFYTVLPSMNKKSQESEKEAPPTSTLDIALNKPNTNPALQSHALDDEPTLTAQQEAQPVTKLPNPGTYFIQAGSFRRIEQAEELKAELALTGFEASIQTFKMGDRDNRYRVLIGPFSSKDQAQNRQMHLEQALQLHSVVLKITV